MKTKTANRSRTYHHGVEPQASDHFRGSLDAPLTLIEYGDYQCPYCGLAHTAVAELIEELGDRLCYVYRNFPLTEVHEKAEPAAEAAEAAGRRGKFWEMHDALFENQDALDQESLAEYARDLGLDAEQILEEIEA